MALGAHQAGFSHVWANDLCEDSCETLKHNLPIPEAQVRCGDVNSLDFETLPAIDGLAFGFPCNDFSVVNDRQGTAGRYGRLYLWGVHALKLFQPLFFVAENVGGLTSSGGKKDFATICDDLVSAGYEISWQMYRFEQYGVPQNRHRVIIVGFRQDLGISDFEHPAPTTPDTRISAEEALDGIPADAANHEPTKHSAQTVERLKHIKPGENVFTADLPDHLKLNYRSEAKMSLMYKRLKPDKPAYTVTGSGGGGTQMYHWEHPRALTNRERARLQSFPDSFEFLGGKESVRKQIGMAVPPVGAKIVFEAVAGVLGEHGVGSQCEQDAVTQPRLLPVAA